MRQQQCRTDWGLLLRCLLLIAVGWPGPRPCVHNHQHFGEKSSGAQSLERHLAEYHGHQQVNTEDPELLHFHWVLFPDQSDSLGQFAGHKNCSLNELRTGDSYDCVLYIVSCLSQGALVEPTSSVLLPAIGHETASYPQGVRLHQLYCLQKC